MSLYVLAYSWYEEYQPIMLEGPEVADWKAYCDALIPDAAVRAITTESSQEYPGWIGWHEIVKALTEMLIARGFKVLEPPEADYWGTSIIRDEDDDEDHKLGAAMAQVLAANAKVKAQRDQWHMSAKSAAG